MSNEKMERRGRRVGKGEMFAAHKKKELELNQACIYFTE